MKSMSSGRFFLCCALALGYFLAGCADQPHESYADKVPTIYVEGQAGPSDWPDKILLEQFAGYWYYRFAGGVSETWVREAPHFRVMADYGVYERYILGGAGHRLSEIEVRKIEMLTDNLCQVLLNLRFQRAGQNLDMAFRARWVLLEGSWFHVLRDPIAFPFSASLAEMR